MLAALKRSTMADEKHLKVNRPQDPSKLLAQFYFNSAKLRTRPTFKIEENSQLLDVCVANLKEYIKWAPDYDFSPDVHANGFWSIAMIANKLTDFVLQNDGLTDYLVPVIRLFNACFRFIKATKEEAGAVSGELHSPSIPLLIDLMQEYLASPEAIRALSGPLCGFHLSASERATRNLYMTLIGLHMADNSFEAARCLTSKDFRGQLAARFAPRFDVSFTKKMLTIPEFAPIKTAIPCLLFWILPSQVKNIFVTFQSRWQLGFTMKGQIEVRRAAENTVRARPVRVKYLLSGEISVNPVPSNRCVMIDLHGGGFVGQSPETHEMYTRHWSTELQGVPILSVDYSHAPEHKFPVALQEILDVYLWLTSKATEQEVIREVGFVPQRIVVVGDSAGGNLAMAVTFLLNDIRKRMAADPEKGDEPLLMVSGVVLCYSALNVKPTFCPSHFLTSCDPFLSAMVLFNLIDAYVPTISEALEEANVHEWSSGHRGAKNVQSASGIWTAVMSAARWMSPLTRVQEPVVETSTKDLAWFACSKAQLLERIAEFGDLLDHPYISPIKYKDYESIKDVSLHLVSLQFDPLLDDSIEMAKKWRGNVSLDVLDDLNHGFLHFIHYSEEAMAGCDLVVRRIKQALKINC